MKKRLREAIAVAENWANDEARQSALKILQRMLADLEQE